MCCRGLGLFFAFVLNLVSVNANAAEDALVTSGFLDSAETVSWSFNDSTGELLVLGAGDGNGEIPANVDSLPLPYNHLADQVISIRIKNVETIGDSAFKVFKNAESLSVIHDNLVVYIGSSTFPANVKTLNVDACQLYMRNGGWGEIAKSVTTINLGNHVRTIRDGTFRNFTSVEKLVIPDSVKMIGAVAFSGMSSLKEITLGEGLSYFYSSALSGCESLETINLNSIRLDKGYEYSDNIYYLYKFMLPYHTSLKAINIGNKVEFLPKIFSGQKNIEVVKLPSSVKEIDSEAFLNSSVKSVEFSAPISKIPTRAFYDCPNLEEIKYIAIDTIGKQAFAKDSVLKFEFKNGLRFVDAFAFAGVSFPELVLPDSAGYLGESSFAQLKGLKKIVVGTRLDSIYYNAFMDNDDLEEVQWNAVSATMTKQKYDPYYPMFSKLPLLKTIRFGSKVKVIPQAFSKALQLDTLDLAGAIDSIAPNAFDSLDVKNLVIPGNIRAIGENAFRCMPNLETIHFEEGVERIYKEAFDHIPVEELVLPNSLKRVYYRAFDYMPNLKRLVIGEGLEGHIDTFDDAIFYPGYKCENITVEYNAIDYMESGKSLISSDIRKKMKKLVIGKNVRQIPTHLCENCTIDSVNFPMGVVSIGDSSFKESSISHVRMENSVRKIGVGAFDWCENLTHVNLSDNIDTILNIAFRWTELKDVKLPSKLKYIGVGAFAGSQLESLDIPDAVEVIDRSAFSRNQLAKISFGKNLREIKSIAFFDNNLDSIVLPENLEIVEDSAFGDNSVTLMVVPKSVKYLGKDVLYVMWTQAPPSNVYLGSPTPPAVGRRPLVLQNKDTRIHIPCGSTEAYIKDSIWNQYASYGFYGVDGTFNLFVDDYCQDGSIEEPPTYAVTADLIPGASGIIVQPVAGGILLENAVVGYGWALMDLQGRVVACGVMQRSSTQITVPAPGRYILRVGNVQQIVNVKYR